MDEQVGLWEVILLCPNRRGSWRISVPCRKMFSFSWRRIKIKEETLKLPLIFFNVIHIAEETKKRLNPQPQPPTPNPNLGAGRAQRRLQIHRFLRQTTVHFSSIVQSADGTSDFIFLPISEKPNVNQQKWSHYPYSYAELSTQWCDSTIKRIYEHTTKP